MIRQQIINDSFSATPNSWETVAPYRKSLKIYFDSCYIGNAIFLAISVTNTGAMGIVCPDHEASDTFQAYSEGQGWSEEEYDEYEEIAMANSFYL